MEKDHGLSNEEQTDSHQKEDQPTPGGISNSHPETKGHQNTEAKQMSSDKGSGPKQLSMVSGEKPDKQELLRELVQMGFREDLAKLALEHAKDIEEATNIILIMQENDDGKIAAPTKAQARELHYKMVRSAYSGDSCTHRHQDDSWQNGCSGGPWGPGGLQTRTGKMSR